MEYTEGYYLIIYIYEIHYFLRFCRVLGGSGRRQLGKYEMRTVTLNPAYHSSTAFV